MKTKWKSIIRVEFINQENKKNVQTDTCVFLMHLILDNNTHIYIDSVSSSSLILQLSYW